MRKDVPSCKTVIIVHSARHMTLTGIYKAHLMPKTASRPLFEKQDYYESRGYCAGTSGVLSEQTSEPKHIGILTATRT
jgi:hypothetical protein